MVKLEHFGFLLITGKDAQKFLQGYATCDLDNLKPNNTTLGAICNIQGRMVCNFRLSRLTNGLLLRMTKSLVNTTIDFLQKYSVFSKAKMTDLSDDYRCYGLIGMVDDSPQQLHEITNTKLGLLMRVSTQPRYELWSTEDQNIDGSLAAWLRTDIAEGYAWVNAATRLKFMPQMFNLHQLGGISFDKGCYLGQEIVARMQYRGELKKRLHLGQAQVPTQVGDNILNSQGNTVGTIVAVADTAFLAVIQTKTQGTAAYRLADNTELQVKDLTLAP